MLPQSDVPGGGRLAAVNGRRRSRDQRLRVFDWFRKAKRIATLDELEDFLDRNAAFLVQKCIFEYSRARAGRFADQLFKEPEFRAALEGSRWRAYPYGLMLVGEMVEGQLRAVAAEHKLGMLEAMRRVCLRALARYPRPEVLDEAEWIGARERVSDRMARLQLAAPKAVKDIPLQDAQAIFDLMPIHKTLRTHDFELVRNSLRVTLCRIYEDFAAQADLRRLADVAGEAGAAPHQGAVRRA